jgi:hypothetical protein
VQDAQTAVAAVASAMAANTFFMLSPQKGTSESMSSNPLEGLEAFLTGAASFGLTDRLINFLPVFSLVLSHPAIQRSTPLTFRLPL